MYYLIRIKIINNKTLSALRVFILAIFIDFKVFHMVRIKISY